MAKLPDSSQNGNDAYISLTMFAEARDGTVA
jgi:hypothetical protein